MAANTLFLLSKFIRMTLELSILIAGLVAAAAAIVWLIAEFRGMREEIRSRAGINNEAMKLKLQAYERLSLLTERISLPRLVTRTSEENPSAGAAAFHSSLVQTIQSEYDYNSTQQIYVNPEVWNAVVKMKDQNIFIIHQLAAHLPAGASALDLGKAILQYCNTPNAELSKVVQEAINYESKKVLDQGSLYVELPSK